MAVSFYTPPSTKIIHWTGVDFTSRPTAFAPIHLVQYDQSLPIIAVNLYNAGQIYKLPTNMDANILVGKRDGTFVSNPALGCNSDRTVLYFEATYQMLYFDRLIKPIVELRLSATETAGSSPITIIIDRNPVQEGAKTSSNEYKSVEGLLDDLLQTRDQIEEWLDQALQASKDAARSEENAKTFEQNARDYAYLKSMNSIILDSDDDPVLDDIGEEILGMFVEYANMIDFIALRKEVAILRNRKDALEARLDRAEEAINELKTYVHSN